MPNSDKRIIYNNDEGGINVLVPIDCGLTVEEMFYQGNLII